MNTFDDPRIGQTYRRNARSPRRARLLSLVFGAIDRLGLGRPLMRLLVRPRGRLSPSANTAAFAGYTPTRHDVFICTYAKSGTNLLLQMVHQITRGGAGDFEHIHDVAPWPDSIHPTGADLEDDHHLRAAIPLRAIKTHLTADHVPTAPRPATSSSSATRATSSSPPTTSRTASPRPSPTPASRPPSGSPWPSPIA